MFLAILLKIPICLLFLGSDLQWSSIYLLFFVSDLQWSSSTSFNPVLILPLSNILKSCCTVPLHVLLGLLSGISLLHHPQHATIFPLSHIIIWTIVTFMCNSFCCSAPSLSSTSQHVLKTRTMPRGARTGSSWIITATCWISFPTCVLTASISPSSPSHHSSRSTLCSSEKEGERVREWEREQEWKLEGEYECECECE